MADDDDTTKLPPLENWSAQTFAYGFLLDRSATIDYSGNSAPNQNNRGGLGNPQPDDIHLLNLNPSQISVREPIATSVQITQGGGKFIESKGGVIKNVVISGTSGFMPPVAPHATHMQAVLQSAFDTNNDSFAPVTGAVVEKATGFFEFYRLRRLFRQFMRERRQGKSVQMHWLDFKGDEFWSIEPKSFDLQRGRFTYTYTIAFDLIEPSQNAIDSQQGFDASRRHRSTAQGIQSLLNQLTPINAALDTPTRSALTRISQMTSSASSFVKKFTTGVVALKFQALISKLTAIQTFFADIASVRRAVLDVPVTLYRQAYSALMGLQDAYSDAAGEAFKADINEWCIEMQRYLEGLISHHQRQYGSKPGQAFVDENKNFTTQRARQGTNDSFMQEVGSASSPTVDPFVGEAGFSLFADIRKMAAVTSMRPENVLTNETIFDVAQRLLGDANRFVDLVIINDLKPPFIVGFPEDKLPGTIAWGETILVPAVDSKDELSTATPVDPSMMTFEGLSDPSVDPLVIIAQPPEYSWRTDQWRGYTVEIVDGPAAGEKRIAVETVGVNVTVNRAFSIPIAGNTRFRMYMETWSQRRKVTPETRAFGRDIMAVFSRSNGLMLGGIDAMIGPFGDVATVAGMDNFEQAIAITLNTPRGSNKADRFFGTTSVVGRRFEPNVVALYAFYVRQSLIQDTRVSSVERPKVVFEGTAMYFTIYVRPVRVQRTLFFRIPL